MSSSLAMTSEYQLYAGLIENNTTDIDKLGTSWVQHRYVDKWKLTESGSYKPIQTTIYDQRIYGTYSFTSSYVNVSSSISVVPRFNDNTQYTIPAGSSQAYAMPGTYTGSLYCVFTVDAFAGSPTTIEIIDFLTGIPVTNKAIVNTGAVQTAAFTLSGPKFNFSNKSTSVGAIKISGLYIYESVTSYSSSLITYPVTASLGTKFQGTGYENARRDGSKLVGSAINANSTQTVDGGPVVKVTKVNPNQVVFAGNQLTTIDRATSGRRPPPINVQNIRSA
jgi:hypothetical protein